MRLKGLSMFANVGMAETFFEQEGVDIVVANEVIEERALFYQHLYPNATMIQGDITDPEIYRKVVDLSIQKGVDFIIATPPCQGMSQAGKRQAIDPLNQLITYVVKAIKEVKPKYVMIENVPEILDTQIVVDDEYILIPDYLKKTLTNYRFNHNSVIRCMDYGIPQMRKRNIFLIVRDDLPYTWEFPEPEKIITLREVIGDLPQIDPLLKEGIEETKELFPDYMEKREQALKISKWNYPPTHSKKHVEWMMHTPSGKSAIYNERYYPQKDDGTRIKAHHNNYRRMNWDKPSRTITKNNGVISSLCCVHPGRMIGKDQDGFDIYSDARALTIYELLLVSTLPKDWNIPPWANESLIRHVIGEGIPPLLTKKLLKQLTEQLKETEE